MSDPIKAALDAAVDASKSRLCAGSVAHGACGPDCACAKDAAAAIAAFLRGLPYDEELVVPITFDGGKVHDVAFYEDWHTLAAAVEEAARHE